jgi:hypothetical protein
MNRGFTLALVLCCFGALFFTCFAPALFMDQQFGYRDAGHYYYPLNQRVQAEWNQGRWPLWEPEESAGMPLLGNPTAAVLYPGKIVFALLPYAWGARAYIVGHSALAFLTMLVLMRSWGTSGIGSALSALSYAFGAPILFQYTNIIYLISAAWLPLGIHAVDRWVRLGRRWGVIELAVVLSMLVLGGDPQAAYLLGVASIGYALGLSWDRARTRTARTAGTEQGRSRAWLSWSLAAIAVVVWCVATLAAAVWLPRPQGPSKPPLPSRLMLWMPLAVNLGWGLVVLGLVTRWVARGRRSPLAAMCVGLVASALVSAAVTAAQLLPVIEFMRQTDRARPGPRELYRLGLEPFRLVEIAWPNIMGISFEGKNFWGDLIKIPGSQPMGWVPSLYLGGLTLALALSALAIRRGPPWRVWLTVILGFGLLGSLGQYTSPLWMARAFAVTSGSSIVQRWLRDLGPIDPDYFAPVRFDGYPRDGDGGFYWFLATALPLFRQFRFPAKLFTFTALGMTGLAGLGWDQVASGRGRHAAGVFAILLAVTVAVLAGAMFGREAIVAWFPHGSAGTMFGPFEPAAAYRAIIKSLGHAAIVLGLGLVLTIMAGRHPRWAGSAALILMTADLACANSRYVLTVPQSFFETTPEVARAIEAAERADPAPGPFRVHRTPQWYPPGWAETSSKARIAEIVAWERDTLAEKYAIAYGLEYTHTMGVAQLDDFEQFFISHYKNLPDKPFAQELGLDVGEAVLYHPRRAYDLWNTRYLVVPSDPNRSRETHRSFASFLFRSLEVYPGRRQVMNPKEADQARRPADSPDFRVLRNLLAFPRAWIVHSARATVPDVITFLGTESESIQEILYANDPIWKTAGRRVYDPHNVAWLSPTDLTAIRRFLSGLTTRPSETVTVTYPSPQQAVLEARLDSPGLVILADVYYPGWELALDGKPAPIYRVNTLMRGAAVPSGSHQLVYTYAPQSFRIGRLVSIAGMAALLVLGAVCVKWPVDSVVAAGPRTRASEDMQPQSC